MLCTDDVVWLVRHKRCVIRNAAILTLVLCTLHDGASKGECNGRHAEAADGASPCALTRMRERRSSSSTR